MGYYDGQLDGAFFNDGVKVIFTFSATANVTGLKFEGSKVFEIQLVEKSE